MVTNSLTKSHLALHATVQYIINSLDSVDSEDSVDRLFKKFQDFSRQDNSRQDGFALMIQLGKVCGLVGGGVADTNYLYPARWGWINILFQTLTYLKLDKYNQSSILIQPKRAGFR